jgi:ubiquinone/menaquinone biosynthesis C-methylase UbiE
MMNAVDSKALSQQRYSKFAGGYVTSKAHAKGAELNRLVEIAQPQPDWIVLDVATGGGHTALQFAPLVAQVIATDITPKMLEAAKAYIVGLGVENVTFRLADAEDLPFEDKAFDLVTCRIAPHHFTDCARFVREGAGVLKPGGLLLVQDHVLPENERAARYVDRFERLRDPSHNRAYAESEWTRMFQEARLEVVHTEQITKEHEFLPWAERQGCTSGVIERLVSMMTQAPVAVIEWMQPRDFGTPQATFVNRHIIIAGRKGR